jgi:hypothetical protein
MTILGCILLSIGCLTSLIGEVMFLAVAYKRSLWWFFGCLFIPFVELLFFFLNLKATVKPFSIFAFGVLMAWFGAQLAGIELWK